MNIAEYYKLHRLEDKLWWHRGRRKIVLGLIKHCLATHKTASGRAISTIADIGCGTGRLLTELHKVADNVVGIDLSPVALGICKKNTFGRTHISRGDAIALPIRDNALDAITALDILEHIPDDGKALDEFRRVLKPGGAAILTVPAHPDLWGMHDVALHHKRRYTYDRFKSELLDHGFEITFLSYAMIPALFGARTWRRIKTGYYARKQNVTPRTDDFMPPAFINAILYCMLCAEAAWLRHGRRISAGLSLCAVIRKK